MASRADNIASNLSLANFSKATERKQRIGFTIGALIVFRFLSFVPLPAAGLRTGAGYEPRRIATGGGSDANALEAAGLPCVNLANGTVANHQPDERVSVAALEGMLEVALRLPAAVRAC